ncbi:hypothetical protein AVEN_246849-1, partial [Araneus ventricosus]
DIKCDQMSRISPDLRLCPGLRKKEASLNREIRGITTMNQIYATLIAKVIQPLGRIGTLSILDLLSQSKQRG